MGAFARHIGQAMRIGASACLTQYPEVG